MNPDIIENRTAYQIFVFEIFGFHIRNITPRAGGLSAERGPAEGRKGGRNRQTRLSAYAHENILSS